MESNIGFEMSLIVAEAIRGRCASFLNLTATVSEIDYFGTDKLFHFRSIRCWCFNLDFMLGISEVIEHY